MADERLPIDAALGAHLDRLSRVPDEIAALEVRRSYLEQKVALWSAREAGDPEAETRAVARLQDLAARL